MRKATYMKLKKAPLNCFLTDNYRVLVLVAVFSLSILLLAFPTTENIRNLLEFNRVLIIRGEWWRVLTGHLVHYTNEHLFFDLLATGAVYLIFFGSFRVRDIVVLTLALQIISSLIMVFFFDTPDIFRGLSGLVHGLLSYGILSASLAGRRRFFFLWLLLIFKVMYEQTGWYDPGQLSGLYGKPIATATHLSGFLSGVMIFFMRLCGSKLRLDIKLAFEK